MACLAEEVCEDVEQWEARSIQAPGRYIRWEVEKCVHCLREEARWVVPLVLSG